MSRATSRYAGYVNSLWLADRQNSNAALKRLLGETLAQRRLLLEIVRADVHVQL